MATSFPHIAGIAFTSPSPEKNPREKIPYAVFIATATFDGSEYYAMPTRSPQFWGTEGQEG
jgi:hypothetical protein